MEQNNNNSFQKGFPFQNYFPSTEYLNEINEMVNNLNKVMNNQDFWQGIQTFHPQTSAKRRHTFSIPIEMFETDKEIIILAFVPGVKKKEINIFFENNRLVVLDFYIAKKLIPRASLLYSEIPKNKVKRKIRLPQAVETGRFTTNYENGILTISLFKQKYEDVNEYDFEFE